MIKKSQIILLQDIRRSRAERVASKYKNAMKNYNEAKHSLDIAEKKTKFLIEKLEETRIDIFKYMTENSLNGETMASMRMSIKILENEIEQSISYEKDQYISLQEADEKKNLLKEEYRALTAACEKLNIIVDMI